MLACLDAQQIPVPHPLPTSEPSALPGTFLARMPDPSDPHMGPPSPGHLQKLSPEFLQCPRPLLLALSQARAAGLQPSFHPRSNRSPPCGRGRVAASTQRSYVGRRPGPRRPRSAVRRACGLGTSLVGQELNELGVVRSQGPVTRSESLDDAGGNTVHVNKRTSRYLRVLTELFQLVTLDSNTRTYQLSPKVTAYTAPYH
jgi:hypothetical protein